MCAAEDEPRGDPADPDAEPLGPRRMEWGVVRQVRAMQFWVDGKGRGQKGEGSAVLGEWKGVWSDR